MLVIVGASYYSLFATWDPGVQLAGAHFFLLKVFFNHCSPIDPFMEDGKYYGFVAELNVIIL